jgi:hypothetical protein
MATDDRELVPMRGGQAAVIATQHVAQQLRELVDDRVLRTIRDDLSMTGRMTTDPWIYVEMAPVKVADQRCLDVWFIVHESPGQFARGQFSIHACVGRRPATVPHGAVRRPDQPRYRHEPSRSHPTARPLEAVDQ